MAWVVSEAITQVWEEFAETMDEDYWLALKLDSEVHSSVIQGEVTEVAQKLLTGKETRLCPELCPEYSTLNRAVLADTLLQHRMADWAMGVVVPLFKKVRKNVYE